MVSIRCPIDGTEPFGVKRGEPRESSPIPATSFSRESIVGGGAVPMCECECECDAMDISVRAELVRQCITKSGGKGGSSEHAVVLLGFCQPNGVVVTRAHMMQDA